MHIEKSYRIGNVYISATNPDNTESVIKAVVGMTQSQYLCVSNVYTVWLANRNEDYRNVMRNAYMCLPDGAPLVWMARLWGLKYVRRTNGPDLFKKLLQDECCKHFLLGDTEDTLKGIKEKYKNSSIVGTYSPPFCPLDEYDLQEIAYKINKSNADIVWISLKAPKQDFFSSQIIPFLDHKICIGVGAAFRFALGEYNHPPKIAQKLGLTGLYIRSNKWGMIKWDAKMFLYVLKWGVEIFKERFFYGKCRG